ncbi:MAG: hypothetical protein H6746_06665 [Deltaproteobacteria bacterium]|nr:hypothetical protein [Deltaproteobacteria bacterium]
MRPKPRSLVIAKPPYTRVAVVQLDYIPAALIDHRSPLEDPAFALAKGDSLEPAGGCPPAFSERLKALRTRIRTTYGEQLWLRIQAILQTSRARGVEILLFPEYQEPDSVVVSELLDCAKLVVR